MKPCVLQDGEKVVYSKYAGTELKVSGTEYVILKVRIFRHGDPPSRAVASQATCGGLPLVGTCLHCYSPAPRLDVYAIQWHLAQTLRGVHLLSV